MSDGNIRIRDGFGKPPLFFAVSCIFFVFFFFVVVVVAVVVFQTFGRTTNCVSLSWTDH